MSNSGNETQSGKTNFASRLLHKELNNRKRNSHQAPVLITAEASKYAVASRHEEKALIGRP